MNDILLKDEGVRVHDVDGNVLLPSPSRETYVSYSRQGTTNEMPVHSW